MVLSIDLAFAQGADRASDRLDASRARSESRYNAVGVNQPKTETVVTEKVITVPVPSPGGDARSAGFAAGGARKPRTKRVVIQEKVTVTKPAPLRINPY